MNKCLYKALFFIFIHIRFIIVYNIYNNECYVKGSVYMYPYLFGIEWLHTYDVLVFLGIVAGLIVLSVYATKLNVPYEVFKFYLILIVVSIIIGFAFAFGFQQLYNYIEAVRTGEEFYVHGITFMGGLVGGVLTFLIGAKYAGNEQTKKHLFPVVSIAMASIAVAHFFGRLGCTAAGCCYGVPTDSWIGINFVTTTTKVIPTQTIEAFFLLIIATVLLVLLNKKKWQYNLFIYGGGYAIFRFIIEYYRGDERGTFLPFFSPSQWQVLFMFVTVAVIFVVYMVKQHKLARMAQ